MAVVPPAIFLKDSWRSSFTFLLNNKFYSTTNLISDSQIERFKEYNINIIVLLIAHKSQQRISDYDHITSCDQRTLVKLGSEYPWLRWYCWIPRCPNFWLGCPKQFIIGLDHHQTFSNIITPFKYSRELIVNIYSPILKYLWWRHIWNNLWPTQYLTWELYSISSATESF